MTAEEVEAASWSGNIGTRMPEGVLGLDIDVYRGGDVTLKDLIRRLGPLPPTWISHSGRNDGSGIRLYQVPAGLAWVSALAGIDLIQRHHRYACVDPSVHPDGREYAVWDQAAEEPGELPPVEDLPELPWPWVAHLSHVPDNNTHSTAADFAGVQTFIAACTEAAAPGYLSVIVAHFDERRAAGFSRHDTAQHCITWALECARAGIVTADTAITTLAELWVAAVLPDERRAEVYSERRVTEFDAMVRHAVGKVEAKSPEEMGQLHDDIAGPRMNLPPPEVVEQLADAVNDVFTPPPPPPPPAPPPLLVVRSLPMPFAIPTVEWHAEALLARPTHGELAGPQKSLKSYAGLCLDVGLAAGLPVFGQFAVPAPQRVLMLVGEGGEGPWLRRLAAVCHAYGIEPGDIRENVRFTTSTASVTAPRFATELKAEVDAFGPDLVHLDPWYAFASSQADTRQVSEMGSQLVALSNLCGDATLWLNHHFNRQDGKGLGRITGAGHGEWADSWWLIDHRTAPDVGAGRFRLRLDVGSRQWGGEGYDLDLDLDPLAGRIKWAIRPAVEGDDTEADPFAEVKLDLRRIGRKARKALTRQAWVARCKRRRTDSLAAFDELVGDGLIVPVATVRSGNNVVSTYQVSDP